MEIVSKTNSGNIRIEASESLKLNTNTIQD